MSATPALCEQHYVIALGSNRCHGSHGRPRAVLHAALAALQAAEVRIIRTSRTKTSAPVGPSRRRYANGAALVECARAPSAMLDLLKGIERDFGRRSGQRWGARVLDLDIILWSGGEYSDHRLIIPHPAWTERRFVTDPVAEVARDWRVGASAARVRHIAARLRKPRPVRSDG